MSINKKVRNATKTIVDGVTYDSKLEAHMAGLLRLHKIEFRLKDKIVLQLPFEYNGENVREIAMFPDFAIPITGGVIYVDAKGRANDVWPLKEKMLKRYLNLKYCKSNVFTPSNKKECEAVISHLLKELGR